MRTFIAIYRRHVIFRSATVLAGTIRLNQGNVEGQASINQATQTESDLQEFPAKRELMQP